MSVTRCLLSSVCWASTTLESNLLLHHPVGDGEALHVYCAVHAGSGSSNPLTARHTPSYEPAAQVVVCCAAGSDCTVTFTLAYLLSAPCRYSAAAACGAAVDVAIVNVSGPPRSLASWSNACWA